VDRKARTLAVRLTKKQIEGSPSLETAKPVSKQFEESYHAYYGWPIYWSGLYMWGALPYIVSSPDKPVESAAKTEHWDPHLRSTRHFTGFIVEGSDGRIGHVDDFVIDDQTWAIRYLIIATHSWWPGKKILIAPKWIESATWDHAGTFKVALRHDAIRSAPEYTELALLTRDHEEAMHRHYERPAYWSDEESAADLARK
jgi:hypothetical protein